ncbi:hypothetical protein ACP4OV_024855 [Aristida adscensionis]
MKIIGQNCPSSSFVTHASLTAAAFSVIHAGGGALFVSLMSPPSLSPSRPCTVGLRGMTSQPVPSRDIDGYDEPASASRDNNGREKRRRRAPGHNTGGRDEPMSVGDDIHEHWGELELTQPPSSSSPFSPLATYRCCC